MTDVSRHSVFRLFAASLAAAILMACGNATSPPPGGHGDGTLTVSADVAGTSVASLELDVSAADISPALAFDLTPDSAGIATDTITIPAGSDRLLVAHGFDAHAIEVYRGSTTVTIKPDTNAAVTITLESLNGQQPITLTLATYTLTLDRKSLALDAGQSTTLVATVTDAAGRSWTDSGVTWGSRNPGIATVDTDGAVTAKYAGLTEIVAYFRGIAATATVVVGGVAPPGVTGAARLLFVSNRGGNGDQLYSAAADGSDIRELTNGPPGVSDPAWSFDAHSIGFDRPDSSGNTQVYVMNADGTNLHQVTFGTGGNSEPALSPHGGRIAYVHTDSIFVALADGSGAAVIHAGNQPAWSPDGSRLAFEQADGSGNYDVYVMNPDGSGVVRVTNAAANGGSAFQPQWSPNGSRLAYAQGSGSLGGTFGTPSLDAVWIVNADGSAPRVLGLGDNPSWAADGSSIYYASETLSGNTITASNLYRISVDSSQITQITSGTSIDLDPTAQPSGHLPPPGQIAFTGSNYYGVYTVAPDGTNLRLLTKGTPGSQIYPDRGPPAWSPDGASLAFVVSVPGQDSLYAVDRNGTNQRFLFAAPAGMEGIETPVWAPNGSDILFSSISQSGGGVLPMIQTIGSTSARPFINDTLHDFFMPAWSPDGQYVAFAVSTRTNWQATNIQVYDAGGNFVRSITDFASQSAISPSWSPDGTRLAFFVERSGQNVWDLYTANADGSGLSQLVAAALPPSGVEWDLNPYVSWSPDGAQLAFPTVSSGSTLMYAQLSVVNADGTGLHVVSSGDNEYSPTPAWNPIAGGVQ